MSSPPDTDKLAAIQAELYKIAEANVQPDDSAGLLATSAMMLKTALELYTVVLDDEAIMKVLEIAVNDLPKERGRMCNQMGQVTIH